MMGFCAAGGPSDGAPGLSWPLLPTNRPPTHPGEMLLKEFLEPLGVSQIEAADRMKVCFSVSTAPTVTIDATHVERVCPSTIYSARSVAIGSIRVARRAGT